MVTDGAGVVTLEVTLDRCGATFVPVSLTTLANLCHQTFGPTVPKIYLSTYIYIYVD